MLALRLAAGINVLVRAECMRCAWLLAEKVATINGIFGPNGVRALPLAAGIHIGGHYKGHFFFLSLSLLLPANC